MAKMISEAVRLFIAIDLTVLVGGLIFWINKFNKLCDEAKSIGVLQNEGIKIFRGTINYRDRDCPAWMRRRYFRLIRILIIHAFIFSLPLVAVANMAPTWYFD